MKNLTVDRTCQLYFYLSNSTHFFHSSLLIRATSPSNYRTQDPKIYYYSLYLPIFLTAIG